MNSIIKGLLTKGVIDKLSSSLGSNSEQTKSAMEGLIPSILGGLAKNTRKKEGAELLGKVLKDHDGSILDNLDGFLGNVSAGKGDKILSHVLGDKTSEIGKMVGEKSGLGEGTTGKLMEILAPMVMGAVGKETKAQGIGTDMLSGLLKGSMKDVLKDGKIDYMSVATMFLDKDGDGDIKDDLMDMGKNYLKKFMS